MINPGQFSGGVAFWSDDFDMDLLKVVPNVIKDLGKYADRKLWTVGHLTAGRLNHPTVWNTHGAFVWLKEPVLLRDEHGWFNVLGCVSNEPIVECTWLELLRDQWPHHYPFVLLPKGVRFPEPPMRHFERLMYDLRGWHKDEEAAEQARMAVRVWVVNATRKLKAATLSNPQVKEERDG